MKLDAQRTEKFEEVIRELYATDPELIDKYHVLAPTDFESAVKDTVEAFKTEQRLSNFEMWEIREAGKLVAYFGISYLLKMSLMTGYFVLPQYRNSEFFPKFFSIIKSKMPRTWFTAPYKKNTRAIKFLKKNNFVEDGQIFIQEKGENALIFKYN